MRTVTSGIQRRASSDSNRIRSFYLRSCSPYGATSGSLGSRGTRHCDQRPASFDRAARSAQPRYDAIQSRRRHRRDGVVSVSVASRPERAKLFGKARAVGARNIGKAISAVVEVDAVARRKIAWRFFAPKRQCRPNCRCDRAGAGGSSWLRALQEWAEQQMQRLSQQLQDERNTRNLPGS